MAYALKADTSQKVMTDSQPFRFLDLSKELRLMVYERLPIKTTVHEFDPNPHDPSFDPRDPFSESMLLQLVWKTLSGINVLATCQQINFEAKSILGPVLSQLKQDLIRLVASTETLSTTTLLE
jgi:hypothetical protein